MSIRSVAGAIRQVRTQLQHYPTSNYWYNEATTRLVLINPMIESLGWNLCNLYQCGYEIDPKGEQWGKKPADYVLGAPSGRSVIVIEAKRLNLFRYSRSGAVGWIYRRAAFRIRGANQWRRLASLQSAQTWGFPR